MLYHSHCQLPQTGSPCQLQYQLIQLWIPTGKEAPYTPKQNMQIFIAPTGGKRIFLSPSNKPSQWKHHSLANELSSPELFPPMNFHFSLVDDFLVPPFFL